MALSYNDLVSRGLKQVTVAADDDDTIPTPARVMGVMLVGTGSARLNNSATAAGTTEPNVTFPAPGLHWLGPNGLKYGTAVSVDVTTANPVTVFYLDE